MAPPLRVNKGEILVYRVFDVGDEIVLDMAERACAPFAPKRAVLSDDITGSLAFASSPVALALGERTLRLKKTGTAVTAPARARLFDYGAVSILYEVPIPPGSDLGDLLPLCDDLYDSDEVERAAREDVDALAARLGPAIGRSHGWRGAETYTVIFLVETEGALLANDVLGWPLLPRLLIGEPRDKKLSLQEAEDVLKHAHSYFDDDLAVIDWNSALVLEPSGSRAIPDILEFATSQLLELRYYDGLFDEELARIYDDLEVARRTAWTLMRDPYTRLAKAILRRIVELTEFTERVDNAIKLIGDFYLARVYQSAVRRFRIAAWRTSIDGKQRLVAQAYGFIKAEIDVRRSTMLELIVILLILAELVTAVRR